MRVCRAALEDGTRPPFYLFIYFLAQGALHLNYLNQILWSDVNGFNVSVKIKETFERFVKVCF